MWNPPIYLDTIFKKISNFNLKETAHIPRDLSAITKTVLSDIFYQTSSDISIEEYCIAVIRSLLLCIAGSQVTEAKDKKIFLFLAVSISKESLMKKLECVAGQKG